MTTEPWLEEVARALCTAQGAFYDDYTSGNGVDEDMFYAQLDTEARAAYAAFKRLRMIVPDGGIVVCAGCGQPLECVPDNCEGWRDADEGDTEGSELFPCPIRKGAA